MIALAGLVLLAVLAGLHYVFWTRRLRLRGGEDQLLLAETRDGWRVALGRRLPVGEGRLPPVLLVHGVSTDRSCLDFGMERWSLAAHLARAGFECYALDLRGHGDSRPAGPGAPRDWSFDTYLREDVPAALEAVRRASGQDRVLWVGHSLGGLLGIAACQVHPDRIAGLVALAAPAFLRHGAARHLLSWSFLFGILMNRFLARMLAPFAGLWQPAAADLAINLRNVERPVLRRFLSNSVGGVPRGVLRQLASWVSQDRFDSVAGDVDYRAGLAACRQPALFVSAPRDGLAPPEVVRAAHQRWGGPAELWDAGEAYGHTDLLLGRRAPEEVYPRIRDWLLAHSRPAERPACLEVAQESSSTRA